MYFINTKFLSLTLASTEIESCLQILDSQVSKDRLGKKCAAYLVHFQGWNNRLVPLLSTAETGYCIPVCTLWTGILSSRSSFIFGSMSMIPKQLANLGKTKTLTLVLQTRQTTCTGCFAIGPY